MKAPSLSRPVSVLITPFSIHELALADAIDALMEEVATYSSQDNNAPNRRNRILQNSAKITEVVTAMCASGMESMDVMRVHRQNQLSTKPSSKLLNELDQQLSDRLDPEVHRLRKALTAAHDDLTAKIRQALNTKSLDGADGKNELFHNLISLAECATAFLDGVKEVRNKTKEVLPSPAMERTFFGGRDNGKTVAILPSGEGIAFLQHVMDDEDRKEICAECQQDFSQSTKRIACDRFVYHEDCFRCGFCERKVSAGSHLTKHGKPMCAECSPACIRCQERVTGDCVVSKEKCYHRRCFCCATCGKLIESLSNAIENGAPRCFQCRATILQPVRMQSPPMPTAISSAPVINPATHTAKLPTPKREPPKPPLPPKLAIPNRNQMLKTSPAPPPALMTNISEKPAFPLDSMRSPRPASPLTSKAALPAVSETTSRKGSSPNPQRPLVLETARVVTVKESSSGSPEPLVPSEPLRAPHMTKSPSIPKVQPTPAKAILVPKSASPIAKPLLTITEPHHPPQSISPSQPTLTLSNTAKEMFAEIHKQRERILMAEDQPTRTFDEIGTLRHILRVPNGVEWMSRHWSEMHKDTAESKVLVLLRQIAFWFQAEEYRLVATVEERPSMLQYVFRQYLKSGKIPFSAHIVFDVEMELQGDSVDATVLDAAQMEIAAMLETEVLPSYWNSKYGRAYLKESLRAIAKQNEQSIPTVDRMLKQPGHILELRVIGSEVYSRPEKHVVYMLEVIQAGDILHPDFMNANAEERKPKYRRLLKNYVDFIQLQEVLGKYYMDLRQYLPTLPKREFNLLGRSSQLGGTKDRTVEINRYLKELLMLPPNAVHILHSVILQKFVEQ